MLGFLHLRSCSWGTLGCATDVVSPLKAHDPRWPCKMPSLAGFLTVAHKHSWPAGHAGPLQRPISATTIQQGRLSRTADDIGQGRVAHTTLLGSPDCHRCDPHISGFLWPSFKFTVRAKALFGVRRAREIFYNSSISIRYGLWVGRRPRRCFLDARSPQSCGRR